jgi:predicted nucleic acid-binding protein
MRKSKIYLDTSVISHLEQPEKPEVQEYTYAIWKEFLIGKYEIYISNIVIYEINKCASPKREILLAHLTEFPYSVIEIDDEISALAAEIINNGILPPKCVEDSQHIAAAVINGCDFLLSWNMKHLSNVFTNEGIRQIAFKNFYKPIQIIPPSMLLREDWQ